MNGNKSCSIKGCNYKAKWTTMINGDKRLYCICPKHKSLILNPLRWEQVK